MFKPLFLFSLFILTAGAEEISGNVDLGVAEIDAIEGEAQGVTSVVKRYKGRIKLCYDQALRQDPNLQGRIEIEFSMGSGRVLDAYVYTNTTRNRALAGCVLRKVKGLTFDSGLEADVVYPFVFSNEKLQEESDQNQWSKLLTGPPAEEIVIYRIEPGPVIGIDHGGVVEPEPRSTRRTISAEEMDAKEAEVDILVAELLGTLGAHNSGESTQDHFANLDFQGQNADALLRNASRMESSTSIDARREGNNVRKEGNVDLGAAEINIVGGETQGVISVVKRYKGRIKLCYDQALRQDSKLSGRIEIEFSVGRGRVLEEAYVITNTTRNDALGKCILRKVKGLTFDSGVEADVVYPFVLSKR